MAVDHYKVDYSIDDAASWLPAAGHQDETPGPGKTLEISGLSPGLYQMWMRLTGLTGDTTPVISAAPLAINVTAGGMTVVESPVATAAVTATVADLLVLREELLSTVTATTTSTELLKLYEALATAVTANASATDIAALQDQISTAISAAATVVDYQPGRYADTLRTDVTATVTVVEIKKMLEEVQAVITASATATEGMVFHEAAQSAADIIASVTDTKIAGSDTTPDAFTFTDQTNVIVSTLTESNTITVAGINASTSISITGGEYSKNSGTYTATSGTVVNGDTVKVRQTSSASNSTAQNTVLTIGGVSDTFTVTTTAVGDTTKPVVTAFYPTVSRTTSVITSTNNFTATDAVDVTGFLFTESTVAPPQGQGAGMALTVGSAVTTMTAWEPWANKLTYSYIATHAFTCSSFCAWVRDAAGNVSQYNDSASSCSRTFTIAEGSISIYWGGSSWAFDYTGSANSSQISGSGLNYTFTPPSSISSIYVAVGGSSEAVSDIKVVDITLSRDVARVSIASKAYYGSGHSYTGGAPIAEDFEWASGGGAGTGGNGEDAYTYLNNGAGGISDGVGGVGGTGVGGHGYMGSAASGNADGYGGDTAVSTEYPLGSHQLALSLHGVTEYGTMRGSVYLKW